MTKLLLHRGAREASFDELLAVETPEPEFRGDKRQRMYYPIPHAQLVAETRTKLETTGARVVSETHALDRNGQRYFGLLSLDMKGPQGYEVVIGLRNAHDGMFKASIALGERVFVCDNLSFSGDVKLSRAHTRYIARDLPHVLSRALGRLAQHRHAQEKRFGAYAEASLADVRAKALILDGFLAGVMPNAKIQHVLQEWREPTHADFQPRTVWSLYNAFTEALKGTNLHTLPGRTAALQGLLDGAVGLN